MDDPLTSHPFYWAGFAIIGDGERQLLGDVADNALAIAEKPAGLALK